MDPNLRNGVQWWKGSIVADKAASDGITPAGLCCFPKLDGIMAEDILLSELSWCVDDRQALPSNPTELSLSGTGFPISHKQWVW